MFGNNFTLFTLWGFRVRANVSWLFLAILVTWSLSSGFFPAQFPDLATQTYWLMGIVGMIGLFFSLLFHEFSHSLVARLRGMPVGGITLFLFGGVSEMSEEPPTPRIEAEVAGVGPFSSVVLGGVFYLLGLGLQSAGLPEHWVGIVGYLATINVILAVFNLVPGFPLDGGRLLRALIWKIKGDLIAATKYASYAGQGFGILLIVAGVYSIFAAGALGGIWWILIGLFLNGAARAGYQQLIARVAFRGKDVSKFMSETTVSVSPGTTLERFVEDYAYKHHYSLFPVVQNGELVGCIRTRSVKDVAREEWSNTTVGDVMKGCQEQNTIRADGDAEQALQRMQRSDSGQIIVVDDSGRLCGMLTLRDLLEQLSLRRELEGSPSG